MRPMSKQEVAEKAATELRRRGWVQGEYAQTLVENPDFVEPTGPKPVGEGNAEWEAYYAQWSDAELRIPIEDCKVCAMGALGAAYFGDPERGVERHDPVFLAITEALADLIRPGWRHELNDYDGRTRFLYAREVVTHWNDEEVTSGDEVIEALEVLATR